MKTRVIAAAALFFAPALTEAGELGACGDGRGVQSIIASSVNGVAVGSGLERGVVVYLHGLSKADGKTIDMPYGAGLLVEPGGARFALRQGKTLHLYSFSGFQRLAKSSAGVLKDQSIIASSWVDGADEVTLFSSLVKESLFGVGDSKKTPYLLHVNLKTGAGRQAPLQISNDYLSAAFDAKGERLAVAFNDGHVEVLDASDGRPITSYRGHDAPWNSLGLAFHPKENLLASSDGGKLIYYDLDRKQIRSLHRTEDGSHLLQFVADGRFLIGGSTTDLSLLNLEGRRLETSKAQESYEDFYVADPLRKVFSVRDGNVCWRTFSQWEKVPVVAAGGTSKGSAPAPSEVTHKGVPLSWHLEQLRTADTKARLDALYAIGEMGPPARAAVPELLASLSAPEWMVRAAAARALGRMGADAKSAIPALTALRKDKEEECRRVAEQALVEIAKAESAKKDVASGAAPRSAESEMVYKGKPLSHYVRRLNDKDFTARLEAFVALKEIGPAAEAAVPELIAVLDGKEPPRKPNEPSLKDWAIRALGAIGPGAAPAVPKIAEALKDSNPEVRKLAAAALSSIGPAARDSVSLLIEALKDSDPQTRSSAAQALGDIGPAASSAIPALKTMKKDKQQEQWLRNAADSALEKIERNKRPSRSSLSSTGKEEEFMRTIRALAVSLAIAALLFASAAVAATKAYQVTGPVLEVSDTMIAVQKGKDRWEIARDSSTKVSGDLKVGAKVTIEYRMIATSVEVKGEKAAKKSKK